VLLLVVVIVIGCCYYSCFLQSRSTVEQRQSKLTHTRIVINNIKDTITALFHMVVRADASEHGRQPQVGPGIVTGVPATKAMITRVILIYIFSIPNGV